MRKMLTAGVTGTVVAATAAVAMAQAPATPTISGTTKATPVDAGTLAKPVNGQFYAKFDINAESESTLRRIEYTIPPKIRLNGTGFKKCSADFINQNGDDACPKGSKVGTGAATALLGPQKSQLDFSVEVYVAGPKALTLYLQTNLFNVAIPATINKQVVGFDIPERVQRPVGGLYSYVTSVTARIGKQKGVPATTRFKGKTRFFASIIGCPNGKHRGKVKVFLADNPNPPAVPSLGFAKTSRCTK